MTPAEVRAASDRAMQARSDRVARTGFTVEYQDRGLLHGETATSECWDFLHTDATADDVDRIVDWMLTAVEQASSH